MLAGALAQVDHGDPFYGGYVAGWILEPIVLIASVILAFIGIFRVLRPFRPPVFTRSPNPGFGLVRASVLFAAPWFWWVLAREAASDVLGFYVFFYAIMAYAALLVGGFLVPILGLYHPADVAERGNLAAGLVLTGFALGTAFAFGGALTGEGPGWWVVVVFFMLAYLELRASLAAVARVGGGLDDDVRLDRDVSAGLLLGAVALSAGIVSGRAAAGDFLGWEHALRDYGMRLWPLLVIGTVGALGAMYTRNHPNKLGARAAVAGVLVLGATLVYAFT